MKKYIQFPAFALIITLAAGCGKGEHDHDHDHNGDGGKTNSPSGGGNGGGATASGSELAGPHVKLDTPAVKDAAQPTSMAEVTKHLDFGGSFYLYWSTEQLLAVANELGADVIKLIDQIAPPGQEKAQIQLAINLLKQGWQGSGLNDISGLGASSFAVERGLNRNVAFLHHHPGKDNGLIWKLLGTQPHEQGGLKLMPAATLIGAHSDLDTALLFKKIKGFIQNSGIPPLVEGFNEGLAQANEQVGLERLLATLDGEMGFTITLDDQKKISLPLIPDQPIQIGHPGLILAAKVKNAQILEFILQTLQAQDVPVQKNEAGGVSLHTIPVPAELPPDVDVSPTLFISGGYLVATSSQSLAKEVIAIQQGQNPGLAGTAEFKKFARDTDLKGNAISFVSSRYMTEYARLMKIFMTASPDAADMPGAITQIINKWMNHSMLQSSGLGITRVLPNGILTEAHATGPGYDVTALGALALPAVAVTGIAASMLLPALAKAKARANAIKTVSNAKQLSSGLRGYAFDNDDKLPPADKWCDLILRDVGTPLVFGSFQDPNFTSSTEGKICSFALNANVAGKNLNNLAPNTVIIFECPLGWNGTGGLQDIGRISQQNDNYANLRTIAVALADGSARQVTFFDLEDLNWTGKRR